MKINRVLAIEFLVAIGFKSAEGWDDAKLSERLLEVPDRLTSEAIPDKHRKTYDALAAAKKAGEKTVTLEAEPATSEAKGKKGKAPKVAKAPKAKKEKKAKAPKPAKNRDAWGASEGSKRYKINAHLSKDWQTDAELAKLAGVTVRQARLHLRRMVRKGHMEKLRTIAYRIPPKKADKAA